MSLLAILCETVAHESCTVRVACAKVIGRCCALEKARIETSTAGSLIPVVDIALLKSRLLPAMITLASDDNGVVRQVMPHALLLLSSTIKNDSAVRERIGYNEGSICADDGQNSHAIGDALRRQ